MADFGLDFQIPPVVAVADAKTRFFWPAEGTGSFYTPLGPRLGKLGPVKPANVDLVRIAVMVYAADRSVLRRVGRVNWTSRRIELTVPVPDPATWSAVANDLTAVLEFLSGDQWKLSFRAGRPPRETVIDNPYPTAKRVVVLTQSSAHCWPGPGWKSTC